mgnify:CR=1 FL=1
MLLKKIVSVLLFLGIVIILLFSFKNNNKETAVEIGGKFELTNHFGENVSNKNFKNNFLIVFFGFTNCPDFCPNTLNKISEIINELEKKNDKVIPLFITVDPERDTVLVLKKYLENFHPNIIGLTGTKKQINEVKKKYKIFSKKVMVNKEDKHVDHDHGDHGEYGVDHTTIIYLMDKKGKYLTHFSGDMNKASILKKIKEYL